MYFLCPGEYLTEPIKIMAMRKVMAVAVLLDSGLIVDLEKLKMKYCTESAINK